MGYFTVNYISKICVLINKLFRVIDWVFHFSPSLIYWKQAKFDSVHGPVLDVEQTHGEHGSGVHVDE